MLRRSVNGILPYLRRDFMFCRVLSNLSHTHKHSIFFSSRWRYEAMTVPVSISCIVPCNEATPRKTGGLLGRENTHSQQQILCQVSGTPRKCDFVHDERNAEKGSTRFFFRGRICRNEPLGVCRYHFECARPRYCVA